MLCVVNEWIFHDIDGGNGLNAQERVRVFLEAFLRGPDQLVILRESPWTRKAWQLWTHQDVAVQLLSKLLHVGILIDSAKCRHLGTHELADLPPALAAQVPGKDAYLFQVALAANAACIITTDERLTSLVTNAGEFGIELILRDDWYRRYGLE